MNAAAPTRAARATCPICPHSCTLSEGRLGLCNARQAQNGQVLMEKYGMVTALALDPIEKKPLAHFHPNSLVLSVGGYGCNLDCGFCQNAGIARMGRELALGRAEYLAPEELVRRARALRERGNIGVAYTYNEPLVAYEYVAECARLVHEAGLLNVLVTNGYANEEPWLRLLQHIDAANIDLKGFTQAFYDMVGAPDGLEVVKRNIRLAAARIHVEVTTLVVPGLNDSAAEMDALASWLAGIDPAIPLHLSRFFPAHRIQDRPPTPREDVLALAQIARQHLKYVHTGNM